MNWQRQLSRLLISFFLLSLFIVFSVQPTATNLPQYTGLTTLVIMELLSFSIGIAFGFWSASIVRSLFLAAGEAFIITYLLQPATPISVWWAFLDVLSLEVIASVLAFALTLKRKTVQR